MIPSVPPKAQTSHPFHLAPRRAAFDAPVRRRPGRQQGRALELLGHAIEYLVDTDLHALGESGSPDVASAVAILMRLSRETFAECPEIVPIPERLRETLTRMFGRPPLIAPRRDPSLGPDTLTERWL